MKITGGTYRGRELGSPKSEATHPMGSRERLALFNSLAPQLPEARVLDAYAGTGALGLEALSRGAAHVVFVEKNHKAAATLRQNIAALDASSKTEVLESAVENIQVKGPFDLIFADPPYDEVHPSALAELPRLLSPGGLLVISHPADFNPNQFAAQSNLKLMSTKSYAAAHLSTFYH